MEIVNFLAELWGASLIIISLSLLINQGNIKNMFGLVEKEGLLLVFAMVNVMIGIALVLTYNVWDNSWKIIITILGWLVLLRGVLVLFSPEFPKKARLYFERNINVLNGILLAFVILGCFLVYAGIAF